MRSRVAIIIAGVLLAAAAGCIWLLLPKDAGRQAPLAEDSGLPGVSGTPRRAVPTGNPGSRPAPIEGARYQATDSDEERRPGADGLALTFKVIDPANRPVAGARVMILNAVSPKSDEAGETTLAVPHRQARSFIAGAPGFRIKELPLPEAPKGRIEVRLHPAATLIVRVRHEDPNVALEGLIVALEYDVDAAMNEANNSPEFRDVRIGIPDGGMTMTAGAAGDSTGALPAAPAFYNPGRNTSYFAVQPRKDVVVSGFKKDDAVKVQVQDRYEHVLMEETIQFEDDDTKPIELIVRSKPRTITILVLDHLGRPAKGAHADLAAPFGFPEVPQEISANGSFTATGIFADDVAITASAPGHVPKRVTVDASKARVEIKLDRARELFVELTGGSTAPFKGKIVFEANGETYDGGFKSPRTFWFSAIPVSAGTVRATNEAGRTTSVAVGAADERVTLTLPE